MSDTILSNTTPNLQVFVRFRPLLKDEIEGNHEEIKRSIKDQGEGCVHLKLDGEDSTNKKEDNNFQETHGLKNQRFLELQKRFKRKKHDKDKFSGSVFNGVLDSSDNNADVFNAALKPVMPHVLNGGLLSCFCYGQTGSGKTHTILGSGDEEGMYYKAAEEMAAKLKEINDKHDVSASIQVRFIELHNKKCYDLMNERTELVARECTVTRNAEPTVMFRPTKMTLDEQQLNKDYVGTVFCKTAEEVKKAIENGASFRKVGNSNVHTASSRSHAIVLLSIVTPEMRKAREFSRRMDLEMLNRANGKAPVGKKKKRFKLQKVQVKGKQRLYYAFADDQKCNQSILKWVPEEEYKGKRWTATEAQSWLVNICRRRVFELTQELRETLNPCVGGTLVMVDLAGAEYGEDRTRVGGLKQSREEMNEVKHINSSLWALNEVIRARASGAKRIAYRASPLTMILRRYLQAEDCKCIMMTNLSSSVKHTSKVIKSLKYSDTMAATQKKKKHLPKFSRAA